MDGFKSKVGMDGAPEPYSSQPFVECDPKYMCFRNRYHVTVGLLYIVYFYTVLAVLHVVTSFISMTIGSTGYMREFYGDYYYLAIILGIILNGIVLGCTYFGLRREKRHYLIPFIVCSGFGGFIGVLVAVVSLFGFFIGAFGLGPVIALIFSVLFGTVNIYFCRLACRCRQYFREKEKAAELAASGQPMQQQQAQPFDLEQDGPPTQQQSYQQAY